MSMRIEDKGRGHAWRILTHQSASFFFMSVNLMLCENHFNTAKKPSCVWRALVILLQSFAVMTVERAGVKSRSLYLFPLGMRKTMGTEHKSTTPRKAAGKRAAGEKTRGDQKPTFRTFP